MRSEVGEVRKLLLQYSLMPAKGISIPPRTNFLQKLCGKYEKQQRFKSPQIFEISTKPKDILYAGVSRHFSSCLNFKTGYYRNDILDYLRSKYNAIAFVRNINTGQFLSRVFIHHALSVDCFKEIIVMEQVYGDNFPLEFMKETLWNKGIEVLSTDQYQDYRMIGLSGYYVSGKKLEDYKNLWKVNNEYLY